MSNVKLGIVYYSSTGTNYRMAQTAESIAKEAGAEVRLRKVEELAPESAIEKNPAWKAHVEATRHVATVTLEDLEWADALLFSVPTRFGNVPSQFKQFLDLTGPLWAQGKLANKVVSAMSSASNPHGGQELTVLSIYTTMYHWGAIIAAPGYTDPALFAAGGNPYGTTVTQSQDGAISEASLTAVGIQTRRLLTIAGWVKAGQTV